MAKRNNGKNNNWFIKVTFLAFFISLGFSFISEITMPKVNIFVGIFILIMFIVIGIIFDMIGVAVTSTDEEPLNAMSAKKIKGAKKAVSFKKNADMVSSFCNDVIGDICGIMSGSTAVAISNSIAKSLAVSPFLVTLIVTAMVASLTIGGKAMGKSIAINNSTRILYYFSKVISIFTRS